MFFSTAKRIDFEEHSTNHNSHTKVWWTIRQHHAMSMYGGSQPLLRRVCCAKYVDHYPTNLECRRNKVLTLCVNATLNDIWWALWELYQLTQVSALLPPFKGSQTIYQELPGNLRSKAPSGLWELVESSTKEILYQ